MFLRVPSRAVRPALSAALLCVVSITARGDDPPPAAPADADAVRGWIHQLSAAEFQEREAAKRKLLENGPSALPHLEAGVESDDREQAERCLQIVTALADSDEKETAATAVRVLERLAQSNSASIAATAAAELKARRQIEEERSITALESAGVQVRRGPDGRVQRVTALKPGTSDAICTWLKYLPGLTSVTLLGNGFTDSGLRELADVKDLQRLSVLSAPITDEGLATLSEFKNLESLHLADGNYTGKGVTRLRDAPKLKDVMLTWSSAATADLQALAGSDSITMLSLTSPELTPQVIEALNSLRNLRTLSVSLYKSTDEDARRLARLTFLTNVTLFSAEQITDDGVAALADLKLRELTLLSPHLTDAALKTIGRISTLQLLRLTNCGFSDEGLERLKGLSRLRILHLTNCGVSDAAQQDLRASLPALLNPESPASGR